MPKCRGRQPKRVFPNNGDGDAITEDKKHVDNRADDTDDFHHTQYDNDH